MRTVPAEMQSALNAGVTTLAHVWRVTRRDGEVFGFTDHDRPLPFDALVCEPHVGLSPGAIEKGVGLNVDSASFSGALASEALSEADLSAGLWDGARVDLFRVDWSTPSRRVHLFAGRIGEVRRGVSAFEAELRGLQAPLNVPVGRVFSRFCDADLGDARCGKNIEGSAFRGEGAIVALESATAFRVSGLGAFAEGWFTRGRIVWSEGVESEVLSHALRDGDVVLEIAAAWDGLEIGAEFAVYAGCDKRLETCVAKFANAANFRGFPHMPGNDAMQAGPAAGETHDGSSRWA